MMTLAQITENEQSSGAITQLALALEIAVEIAGEDFQARYLAIYGRAWEALDMSSLDRHVSPSTVKSTVR